VSFALKQKSFSASVMQPYFVSFHPEMPMEENLPPFADSDDPEVRDLLRAAAGVVLPAHVSPWRYRLITHWARDWFPHLDARFAYQGKARQAELFRSLGVRHPETLLFESPDRLLSFFARRPLPWPYPVVLKGDTGGGGSRVFPLYAAGDLERFAAELPGREPALLQQWVEHGGRDLRVVVYGDRAVSYFRVGDGRFYNNLCRGGRLDRELCPWDQERGIEAVRDVCRRVGIDIAGFDLMFPDEGPPVFIEINFHFGRKGLGGTVGHRGYLREAVDAWRARRLVEISCTAETQRHRGIAEKF